MGKEGARFVLPRAKNVIRRVSEDVAKQKGPAHDGASIETKFGITRVNVRSSASNKEVKQRYKRD